VPASDICNERPIFSISVAGKAADPAVPAAFGMGLFQGSFLLHHDCHRAFSRPRTARSRRLRPYGAAPPRGGDMLTFFDFISMFCRYGDGITISRVAIFHHFPQVFHSHIINLLTFFDFVSIFYQHGDAITMTSSAPPTDQSERTFGMV
jgi:hypothetical protein